MIATILCRTSSHLETLTRRLLPTVGRRGTKTTTSHGQSTWFCVSATKTCPLSTPTRRAVPITTELFKWCRRTLSRRKPWNGKTSPPANGRDCTTCRKLLIFRSINTSRSTSWMRRSASVAINISASKRPTSASSVNIPVIRLALIRWEIRLAVSFLLVQVTILPSTRVDSAYTVLRLFDKIPRFFIVWARRFAREGNRRAFSSINSGNLKVTSNGIGSN